VCGGKFSRNSLEIHRQKCLDIGTPCKDCGQVFRGENKLRGHYKVCQDRKNSSSCSSSSSSSFEPATSPKKRARFQSISESNAIPEVDFREECIGRVGDDGCLLNDIPKFSRNPHSRPMSRGTVNIHRKWNTKRASNTSLEKGWKGSRTRRFSSPHVYDPILGASHQNFRILPGNTSSFANNL